MVVRHKPLTDQELRFLAKKLGLEVKVLMMDEMDRMPNYHHYGIINLDDSSGPGTHWVCYSTIENTGFNEPPCALCFDSFGGEPPIKKY